MTLMSSFPSDDINETLYSCVPPFIKTPFQKYAQHRSASGPPWLNPRFLLHLSWKMRSACISPCFQADFCFKIMHQKEVLVKSILGRLDTMSQEKFEFTRLLSLVLLKIPLIHN